MDTGLSVIALIRNIFLGLKNRLFYLVFSLWEQLTTEGYQSYNTLFFCSPFSVIFLPKFYTLFCKIFTFSVNFTLLGVNFTPFYSKICTCPVKIAPFPVNLHFFCKFYTFLGKICNFLIGYYFRILTSAVTLIRLFLIKVSFTLIIIDIYPDYLAQIFRYLSLFYRIRM